MSQTHHPHTEHAPKAHPRRRHLVAMAAACASVALIAPGASTVAADREAAPSPVADRIEVLRLDCRVADGQPSPAATRVRVGCEWTTPTTARVLTLWRSVDGGPRERVASFAHRIPSSYRDVVPASTSRVVYAVIGTDGDGDIVARSRPDGVAIPDAG